MSKTLTSKEIMDIIATDDDEFIQRSLTKAQLAAGLKLLTSKGVQQQMNVLVSSETNISTSVPMQPVGEALKITLGDVEQFYTTPSGIKIFGAADAEREALITFICGTPDGWAGATTLFRGGYTRTGYLRNNLYVSLREQGRTTYKATGSFGFTQNQWNVMVYQLLLEPVSTQKLQALLNRNVAQVPANGMEFERIMINLENRARRA
jgi:hypothetical protein